MGKGLNKAAAILLSGILSVGCLAGTALPVSAAESDAFSSLIYEGSKNGDAGFRNAACSPRMIQLENQENGEDNGKMYVTFECGQLPADLGGNLDGIDPELAAFPIYESVDGGKTWSKEPVGYVQDSKNGWGMMNCPQLYELPGDLGELKKGTLLCAGDSVNIPNDYTPTSMDLCYSTDQGRTWNYYSTFAEGGKNQMGNTPLWEPFLLYHDGRLICYYSDESTPDHSQTLVHKTTTDGKNWSGPVDDMALDDVNQRPGMAIVTQLENGTFAYIYEAEAGGWTGLKFSDDPEKWTPTDEGIYVGSSASPFITTLDTGALVSSRVGSTSLFINSRKDGLGEWIEYRTSGVQANAHNKQIGQLASGKMFIMTGGGFDSGKPSKIMIHTLDINTTGLFKDNYVKLVSESLVVSHQGSEWMEGTKAWSWTEETGGSSGDWGQRFSIEEQKTEGDEVYVMIQSGLSGRVLSVDNKDGIVLCEAKDSTPAEDQLWRVEDHGDGTYSYVNKVSGKALTMVAKNGQLKAAPYSEDNPDAYQKFASEPVNEKAQPYEVQVNCGEGGKVSKEGTFTAPSAGNYYLQVTPERGYQVDSVKVNGQETKIDTRIVIKPVKDENGNNVNQTVDVTFKETEQKELVYICNKADNNIVAAVHGGYTSEGAQLIEWTNNAGKDEQWTFLENEDGTYRIKNYKSGLMMSARTTADGSKVEQVKENSSDEKQLWRLEEAAGYYKLVNVSNNLVFTRGTFDGDVTPFILTGFHEDNSEMQLWKMDEVKEICRYSAMTGAGGKITPAEKGTVQQGTDKTFVMTPDEGYRVKDVTIDGVSVGAVTEYTVQDVQKSFTIFVTFEKIPDTVLLESLTLDTEKVKKEYRPGDDLSLEGLTVTAKYSNGEEKILENGQYVVSGFDSSAVGKQEITVSYTEGEITVSDKYEITVLPAVYVEGLKKAVLMAESLSEGSQVFTADSWAAVQTALDEANALLINPDADQEQIDAVFYRLIHACTSLESDIQSAGLEAAIAGAEAILADPNTEAGYTKESIQAVENALAAARDVLENVAAGVYEDNAAVNAATRDLITAVTQMLDKDLAALQQLISDVEVILADSEKYTADSANHLSDVLEAAKSVITNPEVTKDDLQTAYRNLKTAVTELKYKGNKAELEAAIATAQDILDHAGKYLASTLEGLQEVFDKANAVNADQNASQEKVNEALKELVNQCLKARILGDVNLDGKTDAADSALLLLYNAELTDLTDIQCEAGDVNTDGKSDTADASKILQLAAEMINEF